MSEPGGYAFRERNSITGKWPVIETIPGIPKPTLHQCCFWHKVAFHYYCLLLNGWCQVQCIHKHLISLMVCDVACAVESSIPVCPQPVVISARLCMKTLDSGHHMVRGIHGWAVEDRLGQACATKPQAIFKTVSVRLKLFPVRQSCGVVWIEQVAGLLAFSVCLSGLAGWLVGSCGLASSIFFFTGWLEG